MAYPDFPSSRESPVHPAGPYQLTREEKRVLQECNRESFFRRCVPFMTALGLGAYYGVHLGYFKGNTNYGAVPKVATGLVIGFIAGKLSYKNKCEEKILRLPGGRLKEAVLTARKTKSGISSSTPNDGGYAMPSYADGSVSFNEPRPGSDMDTERHIDTFDDSFKIRQDFPDDAEHGLPSPTGSQFTSYDELRNRNREEYENKRRKFRPSAPGDYVPYSGPYTLSPADERFNKAVPQQPATEHTAEYQYPADSILQAQPRVPVQRKNFYGDIIDK